MVRLFCALMVGAASILATNAAAQVRDSTHGYDASALRFETAWGNVKIIRGAEGTVVGTAGWFRDPGLEALVAVSPRALTEVKDFKANNFRGSLVGGMGACATVVGVLVAANRSNNASSPIIVIGGVSAMVWGAQHLSMSYAALSRAMWWYNRDATRF